MLSETPSVLQVAISSESHRQTIAIHLHERPSFTLISNVLLHPRIGGVLQYNLEVLGSSFLKENAFEGVIWFPVKRSGGFSILCLQGPFDSSGRWSRLSLCWQWPTHAAGQGLVRREQSWVLLKHLLSCPDDAIHSGAKQGRVLPPLRKD